VLPKDVDITTRLTQNVKLNIPVISAAMDTVTESRLAIEMNKLGGLGVVHKNISIEDQVQECRKVKEYIGLDDLKWKKNFPNLLTSNDGKPVTAAAIGIDEHSFVRAQRLVEEGLVNLIFLDTAHGDSINVLKMLTRLKTWIVNSRHNTEVIVGNISTAEAARHLWEQGADGLKVGQGSGSICTTRIIAGIGVPQWSAVFDVCEEIDKLNTKDRFVGVISDGGIRYSGDLAKSLAAGANSVMIGSLLAST